MEISLKKVHIRHPNVSIDKIPVDVDDLLVDLNSLS